MSARGRTGMLVVCALRAELPPRLASLGVQGHAVGVGARALLDDTLPGEGPVLITGTCGALVSGLAWSLALPREVADEGGVLRPDDALWEAARSALAALGRTTSVARLAQARGVVDEAAARAALARETGASFVDLESARLARACERAGRPWAVLRVVSDSPEEPLGWLAEMLGGWPEEDPPLGRVLAGLARRPHHAPRLVRLGWRLSAGRAAVRGVVERLPR